MHQSPRLVHCFTLDNLLGHISKSFAKRQEFWIQVALLILVLSSRSEGERDLKVLLVIIVPPVFLWLQKDEVYGLNRTVFVCCKPFKSYVEASELWINNIFLEGRLDADGVESF